ncbi:hypothetical protein AB0I76_27125, partial [Micromonospora sp. NPDC049799]
MGGTAGRSGRPWRGWRRELGRLAEVAGLLGLVVTQPVLDGLGRSPDFFLFHRADPGEILLLLVLVALVPTLAVGLLGALAQQLVQLAAPAHHHDPRGQGAHRAGTSRA